MSDPVQVHQPCPDCGSSDALAVYDDGHTHCFSCGKNRQGDKDGQHHAHRSDRLHHSTSRHPLTEKPLLPAGDIVSLRRRKLHEETCQKFGYSVGEYNGKPVQIAPYRTADGKLVAQKVRFPDKTFMVTGDMSSAPLFGQHLWKDGGKRLVITEGEIDAMSYAQVSNLSWPVVSIPNGAQGAKKAIQKNLEWVEKFDEVVFLFDMDEPGREAAKECAELLTPGKAKIAELPRKDANEMLQASEIKELVSAVWNAKSQRPDGVINAAELWDEVSKPIVMGTPYPFAGFNKLVYGIRPREIVTLSAGSGIGKSAVCREIGYHLGNKLGETVGMVELESGVGRQGLALMGIHANLPLHLPGYTLDEAKRQQVFKETLGTGRYFFYDHFGSLDSDNLLNKLRYMVKGCGCRFLILDHLSIVVSGMDLDGDERRMIDYTMTKLRQFTEETDVGLILVSHLKRPEGRGHEEGATTSLAQLRGSAAIAQLSDIVIGLERNQQADTEEERQTTYARVLKNRYSGQTGLAGALRWNEKTGRLIDATDDFEPEVGEADDY